MSEKRFEMKGDTHIFDSKTSEEYYAPSEYELVDLLNSLAEENERLKNKLNDIALELVDEVISMGKAVEISEMNYHEFLEYRYKKGKPMELQI